MVGVRLGLLSFFLPYVYINHKNHTFVAESFHGNCHASDNTMAGAMTEGCVVD